MANGTTDIVDTLDNTALRLIQEAQNLAAANNNVSLAAVLGLAAGAAAVGGDPSAASIQRGDSQNDVDRPSNGGGSGSTETCQDPTYRIDNIKEIQVGNYPNLQNSDFANLGVKQCVLIGEIFKCCPDSRKETSLGYVELGRAQVSQYYESCPTGGKKPVIKSYYNVDQLSPSGFVNPSTGQSVNKNVPNGPWSPNACGNVITDTIVGTLTVDEYSSFTGYINAVIFDPDLNPGVIGGALQIGNSIKVVESVQLRKDTGPNNADFGNTILRAIEANCSGQGTCVNDRGNGGGNGGGVGDPEDPCDGVSSWPIDDNSFFVVKEFGEAVSSGALVIPNGWTLSGNPTLRDPKIEISDSSKFEEVPGEPCVVGIKRVITRTQDIVYTYTYSVNGILCRGSTRNYIERLTTDTVEYIDTRPNTEKPECRCQEILDYGDTIGIIDTKDSCKCTQYNLVKVRTKCPGETEYTDSTNFYFEGIPDYLHSNVPAGYKLDPLTPIVTRGDCVDEKIKIYHPLVLGKDVITGKVTGNTRGLFNLAPSMSCYNTSSLQSSASKEYYYDVADCDCDSTPYFAVAFGHVNGSGSLSSQGETNDTATRAIYSQYRLLALESPETRFRFFNSGAENTPDYIYVINFKRDALSDRIDPGNFEIPLIPLSGGAPTGSTVYTFIDNSDDKSELSFCSEDPYVSYDIVSGSLKNGIHSSGTGTTKTTYGKFYPNLGFIVFDGEKVESLVGLETVTGSNVAGDNAYKLFLSISGSSTVNDEDGNLYHIKGRNVKYKTTNHYFVRVSAPNANYSNNPTYVTGSGTGQIQNTCFQKEPVTYVTSVGLYNDRRELLAVAKLSRPVKKTPDDDLLIKIRLNW